MIPPIIHQTAKTKQLSWEEGRLAARLRRLLPGWEYRLWDDSDNARLFSDCFPDLAERYRQIEFGIAQSDLARYAYMHAFGGFYFDTDYKLLKPLDQETLDQSCVLPVEENDDPSVGVGFKLGNAVLGSQKGHPFWSELISFIISELKPHEMKDQHGTVWISGPMAVTQFYLKNRGRFPDVSLSPRDKYLPDRKYSGLSHRGDAETVGIHLCWGSWRGKRSLNKVKNLVRRKITAF